MRRIRQLFVTTTALASAATFFASTPAIAQDEAAAVLGLLHRLQDDVVATDVEERNLRAE